MNHFFSLPSQSYLLIGVTNIVFLVLPSLFSHKLMSDLLVTNKTNSSHFPIRCRFTTPNIPSTYRRGCRRIGTANSLEVTINNAPTSVPVRVAHELLLAGHHYLDVRSREEFNAGHVDGAVNVPYLVRVGSGMGKNTEFMAQVWAQFDKDDEIIIGCQSGKRSLMAASHLLSAGYTGIIDIAGGYDAWIQSHLPILL